jgi:hypothetical protein
LCSFDQVLGLTSGNREPFGTAALRISHHEADVQSLCARLDACGDAPLASPGFGAVAGLGIAAYHRRFALGSARSHVIGGRLDEGAQYIVTGEAADVGDIVALAPGHHLGTAVMAIAANGDVGVRPMPANAAQQTTQMVADFLPR